MSVLLDTHIWVWWLTPPGSLLSRAERDALDANAGRRELFLSAISLWEAQVLHANFLADELICSILTLKRRG